MNQDLGKTHHRKLANNKGYLKNKERNKYTRVSHRLDGGPEQIAPLPPLLGGPEKSIALGYKKKNDESKQTVKLANDLILSRPGLNMRDFLVALSHCQLAALQRRASKLTKASKPVFIAEQSVEFVPSYLAKTYVI